MVSFQSSQGGHYCVVSDTITTVVLAVAMLVAPVQVARADSSGGFEYTITAGAATITGYTGPG
ncbi:MAG: hypothetical protein RBS17_11705, partial [Coriobacteriia bacterium]|nr:hypothetical protein [Coriobacteriia bacterium]